MDENMFIAYELIRLAARILRGRNVEALRFCTEDARRNYSHEIRPTTTVYVKDRIVKMGEDWVAYDERDTSGSLRWTADNFLYVTNVFRCLIPEFCRIKLENSPKHAHDGISDLPPEQRAFWMWKCTEDVEKLNPGLWQRTQEAYNRLSDIEKDCIEAYTYRDLYDINRAFFEVYRGAAADMSRIQMYETKIRLRTLRKLPRFSGDVWRGMNFGTQDELDSFSNKWKKGESPMTGFISTTYMEDNANLYLKPEKLHCIVRIVDSRNGHYIGHISSTPRDEEILFSCNQRFRLVKDGETEFTPVEDVNNVRYITVKEENAK